MIASPATAARERAIVDSVGSPGGTITQTARGGASAATSASSEATPRAPPLGARYGVGLRS